MSLDCLRTCSVSPCEAVGGWVHLFLLGNLEFIRPKYSPKNNPNIIRTPACGYEWSGCPFRKRSYEVSCFSWGRKMRAQRIPEFDQSWVRTVLSYPRVSNERPFQQNKTKLHKTRAQGLPELGRWRKAACWPGRKLSGGPCCKSSSGVQTGGG